MTARAVGIAHSGAPRGLAAAFVVGLPLGALAMAATGGVETQFPVSAWQLVIAGLLVGFGPRLGSGCTSGHGVCGMSRLSRRSMAATILVTLLAGVEPGVIAGVGLSLALFLWRASRPHAAIVGRVPETEHFRNVKRHKVFTDPRILTIRVDESLTYLNARWLEEFVLEQVAEHARLKHLILMCSAVNGIDASALESIEAINHRLADGGIKLHLSEVKGPVMDALEKSRLLHDLTGSVWLSQNEAFATLIAIAGSDEQAHVPPDLWLARGLI